MQKDSIYFRQVCYDWIQLQGAAAPKLKFSQFHLRQK